MSNAKGVQATACAECGKGFTRNITRIACGKCNGTYHKTCSKIKEDAWSEYAAGTILFNCGKCRANRRSSVIGASVVAPQNDAGALKDEFAVLTAAFNSFKDSFGDTEKSLTTLHDSMMDVEKKMKFFEKKFEILDEVVAENTRLKNRMDVMEKRLAAIENSNKIKPQATQKLAPSLQVSISGVQECENEDVNALVSQVFTGLDVDPKSNITKCKRIKSKPVLMVSLKDRCTLDALTKAAQEKQPHDDVVGGDGSKRIYVNEVLPPDLYKLVKDAKRLKDKGYKYVWSRHGKVFVKRADGEKVSVIRSGTDVDALLNAQ